MNSKVEMLRKKKKERIVVWSVGHETEPFSSCIRKWAVLVFGHMTRAEMQCWCKPSFVHIVCSQIQHYGKDVLEMFLLFYPAAKFLPYETTSWQARVNNEMFVSTQLCEKFSLFSLTELLYSHELQLSWHCLPLLSGKWCMLQLLDTKGMHMKETSFDCQNKRFSSN